MGFFATFWSWLNQQLGAYVGDNTARMAAALEPAVVTSGALYVMIWGYLQLTGRLEEPLINGLRRILTLAIVLGVALRLWLYNSLIVDTFYNAPAQLAATIVGTADPVQTLDSIWEQGGAVADFLWNKGGLYYGEPGYYVAGLSVWLFVGMLCVYTMFLIALSHVALSILLAIGPLFIALLLFSGTRRLFDAWVAQLTNYALITILTVLTAGLLLRMVQSYAAQTAARGSDLVTVDALNMILMASLIFLFMRQVMPVAAGLASGAALGALESLDRAVNWSLRAGSTLAQKGARTTAALSQEPD